MWLKSILKEGSVCRLHALLQTVETCSQRNRINAICVVEHMMAKCSIKGLQEM